jgi:dihydrofolate reductase
MLRAILACDIHGGISRHGVMPWPRNTADMRYFVEQTRGGVVVMGSSTWQAPDMPSPLPGRVNIVITSDHTKLAPGFDASYGGNVSTVLPMIRKRWADAGPIWIIGGAGLLHQSLPYIHELHLTRIDGDWQCDVHLDLEEIDKQFVLSYTHSINASTQVEVRANKRLGGPNNDVFVPTKL